MNDFDLRKYLTENKITSNSKLLSENSSQTIEYKGKKYYIEDPEGKERVFAYSDPQLQQVVKVNGKTLMFKTEDVEDMLIKEQDIEDTNTRRNIKKIGEYYYQYSSQSPKKDDWVLKFKQANQMDFKSGELSKKDYKYFPVKVPMDAFLNPEDLKITASNDPKLVKDGIPPLTIG